MQSLKRTSPQELELQEIFNTGKRVFKKLKKYLYLKKEGLTEKGEDIGKKLKKLLEIRNFRQDVHAEL